MSFCRYVICLLQSEIRQCAHSNRQTFSQSFDWAVGMSAAGLHGCLQCLCCSSLSSQGPIVCYLCKEEIKPDLWYSGDHRWAHYDDSIRCQPPLPLVQARLCEQADGAALDAALAPGGGLHTLRPEAEAVARPGDGLHLRPVRVRELPGLGRGQVIRHQGKSGVNSLFSQVSLLPLWLHSVLWLRQEYWGNFERGLE